MIFISVTSFQGSSGGFMKGVFFPFFQFYLFQEEISPVSDSNCP